MRKYLALAAIGSAIVASPAFAQDAEEWTGAYVGIHAGYTNLKSDSAVALSGQWSVEAAQTRTDVVNNWSTSQSLDDMNFGAQIGYNYNFGGAVLGVEADISVLNGEDVSSRGPIAVTGLPSLTYTYGNTVDPKHSISARAKLGLPMGQTLFYAHGGWQWVRAEVAAEIVSNGGYTKEGRVSEDFNGYVVGAGIEHKFSPSVSARLEYAYSDLGDVSYVTAYRTGSTFTNPVYTETVTQDMRMHTVKVGLNYHF